MYSFLYFFLSYMIGSPCGFLNCLCYKTSKPAFFDTLCISFHVVNDMEGTFLKCWYLFLMKFVYGLKYWVMWTTLNNFIDAMADLHSVEAQFKSRLMCFLDFVIFPVQMFGQYMKTDHDSSLIHCNKTCFTLVVDTAFYQLTSTLHALEKCLEKVVNKWNNFPVNCSFISMHLWGNGHEIQTKFNCMNICTIVLRITGFLDPLELICTVVFQPCI